MDVRVRLLTVVLISMLYIPTARAYLQIDKYFNESSKMVIISIQSNFTKLQIVEFVPGCLNVEEVSGGGNSTTNEEGIVSIVWEVSNSVELSYRPVKTYDCPRIINFPPTRVMVDDLVMYSNRLSLDSQEIESRVCNIDGKCEYPAEDYLNCPEDCPSGSVDGICDGVEDGTCDPDCTRLKMEDVDPDCKNIPLHIILILATISTALIISFLVRKSRGTSKFFIKTIYLIVAIIVISIITRHMISTSLISEEEATNIRLEREAYIILEKLLSPDCLGEDEEMSNLIDVNSLNEFQARYTDIEPTCARSYEYGFLVEVEEFTSGGKWRFGSPTHSEFDSLENSITVSIPVAIKISDKRIEPGSIKLTLFKGQLESLAGLIDWVCTVGISMEKKLYISYPVRLEGREICMENLGQKFCRKLTCRLRIYFPEIKTPGFYNIFVRKIGGVVEVVI